MIKMKKILTTFVLLVSLFTLTITKVNAASGTVSISANKSEIVVGNTVTFTVKVSSASYLGAFQYNLSYDSSMLSLTSGESSGAPVFTGKEKAKTYTFKFKAKKAGTATLKFNISGGYTFNEEPLSLSSKSKSIKIITQAQLEATYSKNNNLSSLGVEGYQLSPSFSQSVTSYTVNLPANTESINVTGKKADSKASVEGLGKKTVEDGTNIIKISVTAQNGSTKTYTITAIVEELDPIHVTINDEEYTIIRKAKLLTSPNNDFIASTTKINEEDIPTLFNEKINLTLIGLKDKEGNIELYIYDQTNNTYTKYNQYTFSGLTIYIKDKEIENYEQKEEITIDDKTINAYTIKNDSYQYFYAINLETGKESIYRYDNEENTIQRYIEPKEVVVKKEETDNEQLYKYIIIILLAFILLTYIIILFNLIFKERKNKNKKKVKIEEKTQIEEKKKTQTTNENNNIKEDKTDKSSKNKINEELIEETKELNILDDDDDIIVITEKKDNHIDEKEKKKLIKESEEELIRISEENTTETNDLANTLEEIINSDKEKKKKPKKKSKKD